MGWNCCKTGFSDTAPNWIVILKFLHDFYIQAFLHLLMFFLCWEINGKKSYLHCKWFSSLNEWKLCMLIFFHHIHMLYTQLESIYVYLDLLRKFMYKYLLSVENSPLSNSTALYPTNTNNQILSYLGNWKHDKNLNTFAFQVSHVLSEGSSSWTGLRGRIDKSLLEKLLPESSQQQTTYLCLCGPTEFTKLGIRWACVYGVKVAQSIVK